VRVGEVPAQHLAADPPALRAQLALTDRMWRMARAHVSSEVIIVATCMFLTVQQKIPALRSIVILRVGEVPAQHLAADPPATRVHLVTDRMW
jgi:hypothetical protein